MATSPETTAALLEAARAAREQAYAPYSHFHVGAAVLDEHGRIHRGGNVVRQCSGDRHGFLPRLRQGRATHASRKGGPRTRETTP